MTSSLHENYGRDDNIESSSDRAFGLTVGGILLAIALVRLGLGWWSSGAVELGWFNGTLIGIGLPLVILGLIAPAILAPLNRAWTKLGLLLFTVVNPLVLGLIFALTIIPIGLLLRAFGKDPLRLGFDREARTYWISREPPGPEPESMPQQF